MTKRLLLLLLAAAILVPGLSAQVYRFQNVYSGKVLEVTSWSIANGAQVGQWEWANGQNQQWRLIPLQNGAYEIQNVYTRKALEVTGWSTANGAAVGQWDWVRAENQQWTLALLANGAYVIQNVYTGKVLEDTGWSTANGAPMGQWDWANGANQQWYKIALSSGGTSQPCSPGYTLAPTTADWISIVDNASAQGRNICFQPGTYLVDRPVSIRDRESILGMGSDPSNVVFQIVDTPAMQRLPPGDGTEKYVFRTQGNAIGNTFDNFTIMGYGNPHNEKGVSGVAIESASNVDGQTQSTIKNTIIQSVSNIGVIVRASSVVYVENNQIADTGGVTPRDAIPSLYVTDSSTLVVRNNVITGHDGTGYRVVNADGGVAVYKTNGTAERRVEFYNNTVNNAGIYLVGVKYAKLWSNKLYDTQEWGFDIVPFVTATEDVDTEQIEVTSNVAQNTGDGSVVLNANVEWYGEVRRHDGIKNVLVASNTFTNGNRWGLKNCGGINYWPHPIDGALSISIVNNTVSPAPESCPLYSSNEPPATVSVTPNSGSGASASFAGVYSDVNGAAGITFAGLLINTAVNGAGACYVYFQNGLIYLRHDAGDGGSGAVPGVGTILSNGQCSVNVGLSSVVVAGNNLTMTVAITFTPTFTGTKNLYMYAADNGLLNSGWVQAGTWTAQNTNQAPATVSVTPNSGSGASASFAGIYSDVNGGAGITFAGLLINTAVNGTGACYVYYQNGLMYLRHDAGDGGSGAVPGVGTTLINSQCSVNVGQSSVVVAGNNLTMTVAITFTPTFTGTKNLYMYAADSGLLNSGWAARGTWTPN